MSEETIFAKIIKREIPADIVYEDDLCLAFHDINPVAPHHILLIPKKAIVNLADVTAEDQTILGHLMIKANEIAHNEGFGDAFRVISNSGAGAQQTVFHLHFHIIGGRSLQWPPG